MEKRFDAKVTIDQVVKANERIESQTTKYMNLAKCLVGAVSSSGAGDLPCFSQETAFSMLNDFLKDIDKMIADSKIIMSGYITMMGRVEVLEDLTNEQNKKLDEILDAVKKSSRKSAE